MRWRTKENMVLAVIKNNVSKEHNSTEQTKWLIANIEDLQDELSRQYKHEDYLLEELKKRGWPTDLF